MTVVINFPIFNQPVVFSKTVVIESLKVLEVNSHRERNFSPPLQPHLPGIPDFAGPIGSVSRRPPLCGGRHFPCRLLRAHGEQKGQADWRQPLPLRVRSTQKKAAPIARGNPTSEMAEGSGTVTEKFE
jgi:hypothetical protein